jgi:hypothetical protein
MKNYSFFSLMFIFIMSIYQASAQPQFSGWLASFYTIKTGKKTSIHSDIQLRSADKIMSLQTLLLRAGVNFHLKNQKILTAGYAFINNKKIISTTYGYAPEHRLWQQFIISHRIKGVAISHRFRTEQRFIAKSKVINNQFINAGNVYANRVRYFIRNVFLFNKEKTGGKGLFAALQNELFINFGNKSTVNGEYFDQNRFYIASGLRLNPAIDLEIGYMNQYVNGRGDQFTNNHILQLAGYLKL